MLSPAAAAEIVRGLVDLRLEAMVFLKVCAALAPAIADDISTAPQDGTAGKVSPGRTNGGHSPLASPADAASPRKTKPGGALERARQALAQDPSLSTGALMKRCRISGTTAKLAKNGSNGSNGAQPARVGARQHASATAKAPAPVDTPAMAFLRQALSRGPQPTVVLQELAAQRELTDDAIAEAKRALGVVASVSVDGVGGIVWELPQADETQTA